MKNYNDLMKRCQVGTPGSGRAIEAANNLLAECYAAIGALSLEVEQARKTQMASSDRAGR